MQRKSVRTSFKDYVSRLKNAEPFLRNRGSTVFFHSLSRHRRAAIRDRLLVVDPIGYAKVLSGWRRMNAEGRKRKRLANPSLQKPTTETRRQDCAIIQTRSQELGSPGKVSVISLAGFKRLLSASLAIYRPEEVAVFAGMELTDLNSLVTVEDIAEARKMVPEAIRVLANQRVLRDLSQGVVNQDTDLADRIAARRAKTAIDMHKEMRETEKEDDAVTKKREDDIRKRFGVDRGTGYVEVKEVKEEKVKA